MAKWRKPRGRHKRWVKRHLINKFGNVCQVKGNHPIEEMHDITIDHIVPKSEGGSDLLENLQLACMTHNKEKGSFSQEEFDDLQAL